MSEQDNNTEEPDCTVDCEMFIHELGRAPLTVDVTMAYFATDPHAVTLIFHTAKKDVPWTFARSLLVDGCENYSGEGSVRIWPGPPSGMTICMEMHAEDPDLPGIPARIFTATTDRTNVIEFLRKADKVVPHGKEIVDVDAERDTLFGLKSPDDRQPPAP
jgi:hypothetical protein